MKDRDFLISIHERLQSYGDSELLGHMHTLRAMISNTNPTIETTVAHTANSLDELIKTLVSEKSCKKYKPCNFAEICRVCGVKKMRHLNVKSD